MLNSREFDEKLQINNFEKLEEEFEQAKKFFEHLNNKIKYNEVELNFPAYCYEKQEIRIKFPAYKIRIINNGEINYNDLQELLKNIYSYKIECENSVFNIHSFKPVHSINIRCLGTNLYESLCVAEKIEERLKEENIHTERCVDYGYYRIPMRVNEEGYITIIK